MTVYLIAALIASAPSLAETAPLATTNENSLLTTVELEGGALTPSRAPNLQNRKVNSAMLAAIEADAQIRRIELSLKSGPAQSGDLRVVQSGKPDPNEN
jgi:hypothetical protein